MTYLSIDLRHPLALCKESMHPAMFSAPARVWPSLESWQDPSENNAALGYGFLISTLIVSEYVPLASESIMFWSIPPIRIVFVLSEPSWRLLHVMVSPFTTSIESK